MIHHYNPPYKKYQYVESKKSFPTFSPHPSSHLKTHLWTCPARDESSKSFNQSIWNLSINWSEMKFQPIGSMYTTIQLHLVDFHGESRYRYTSPMHPMGNEMSTEIWNLTVSMSSSPLGDSDFEAQLTINDLQLHRSNDLNKRGEMMLRNVYMMLWYVIICYNMLEPFGTYAAENKTYYIFLYWIRTVYKGSLCTNIHIYIYIYIICQYIIALYQKLNELQ